MSLSIDDTKAVPMPALLTAGALELRAVRATDLDSVHKIFSADSHTIGTGPVTDVSVTEAWVRRRREIAETHGFVWYLVWLGWDLVGGCGVTPGRTGAAEPEIGYEIVSDFQGRGLGTEAARAVVTAAHSAGVWRLWATVRPANVAALKVLANLGFERSHTKADERGPLIYLAHVSTN